MLQVDWQQMRKLAQLGIVCRVSAHAGARAMPAETLLGAFAAHNGLVVLTILCHMLAREVVAQPLLDGPDM